jgi:hypothetical protein
VAPPAVVALHRSPTPFSARAELDWRLQPFGAAFRDSPAVVEDTPAEGKYPAFRYFQPSYRGPDAAEMTTISKLYAAFAFFKVGLAEPTRCMVSVCTPHASTSAGREAVPRGAGALCQGGAPQAGPQQRPTGGRATRQACSSRLRDFREADRQRWESIDARQQRMTATLSDTGPVNGWQRCTRTR